MVWQRARKPEQKEQRRAALLDAAAKLFEEEGLDKVSLNAIARAANISKANIYRYFESREELFLHLMLEDYSEWIELVEQGLTPLAGKDDQEAVAAVLVEALMARPRLGELMAVVGSVLEHNITVEIVVWFKTSLLTETERITSGIMAALPSLDGDKVLHFIRTLFFLVAGMWHAGNPAPAVKQALEMPELQLACIDLPQQLHRSLVVTLRGLRK